jgi:small-conductance mechanosensitive channel
MGKENAREFCQMSEESLRATIAECRVQVEEAQRHTQDNPNFQQASGIISDFKKALNEATKPLTTKMSAAAKIVNQRNEAKKAARVVVKVEG